MVSGGDTEELAAPFDATARVNFYNLDVMPGAGRGSGAG